MKLEDFDPNGTGSDNGNYFGLPFTPQEAALVLLSVPWDVTASYGGGASYGPDVIIGASTQLDLYEQLFPDGWRMGIGTIGIEYWIQERSIFLRKDAVKVIKHLEHGGNIIEDALVVKYTERINAACEEINKYVYETSLEWLSKAKTVGLVGGDHSTPFGLIKALAECYGCISILHIDAHADLRAGYEGFKNSHASIMYNVITKIPKVDKLVQVGIRDLCDCEVEMALEHPKIDLINDYTLSGNRFNGMPWDEQCSLIADKLGDKVYISFDIDGLSPDNCPNTGTPVPGGLSFNEAVYLIDKIVGTGRRIVGFDLCEVAPAQNNEWDANVGARMLYKLCNLTLKSQQ